MNATKRSVKTTPLNPVLPTPLPPPLADLVARETAKIVGSKTSRLPRRRHERLLKMEKLIDALEETAEKILLTPTHAQRIRSSDVVGHSR
jgi:ribosomal protein S10